MRPLTRLFLILGLAALVSGCQTGWPGSGPAPADGVVPNAVLGGDIEVTALDAPPPAPSAPAEGAATAAAQAAPPAPTEAAPAPAPLPEAADPGVEPEPAAAPEAPKSEAQIACERQRGQWMATGIGQLRTCIFTTRDSGKRCTRESDCEGQCLARSGTCSPIRPLLGCNEILQDNGARVTQCIE